jgi:hypothetical protein
MIAPDSSPMLEPDALVDRARQLWRSVRRGVGRNRFDLFLKIARRKRAHREHAGDRTSTSETMESGLAMRMARPGATVASFAACSGVSDESLAWVLSTVGQEGAGAVVDMPEPRSVVEPLRTDLDLDHAPPMAEELESWVADRKEVAWIECGSTYEVVVGDEGWVAVRGRHRSWAMTENLEEGPRLFASRGLAPPNVTKWACGTITDGPKPGSPSATVIFSPAAAAAIIGGLVRAMQGGEIPPGIPVGAGLCVADDPRHPAGLSGGSFDDAGFEARRTILADGRQAVGPLPRAGTLRRASFRDPPSNAPSTLVVFSDAPIRMSERAPIISHCRVLPVAPGEWVLDLGPGSANDHPSIARIAPEALVERCLGTVGPPVVCADGVITPGLVFTGIEIAQ